MKAILAGILLATMAAGAGAELTQAEMDAAFTASVAQAEKEFPDVTVEGSALFNAITAEIARLQEAKDPILQDPGHPVVIARRAAKKLEAKSTGGTQPTATQSNEGVAVEQVKIDEPARRTDGSQFVIAIKEHEELYPSKGGRWRLELGESFPWLGYVKAVGDQWVRSEEKTPYFLLKFDDQTMIAPASHLVFAAESEGPRAAMTYREMVAEDRRRSSGSNEAEVANHAPPEAESKPGYIILRGSGPSRTGTVLRDSDGRVAETLKPGRVYHRRAVDDAEEALLIRKSQAIERGASDFELSQIEAGEELRKMREEIQNIRQQLLLNQDGIYSFR